MRLNIAGVASGSFGELQIVVVEDSVGVVVLRWCKWRRGNSLLEQLRALSSPVRHCLTHDTTAPSGLPENGNFPRIAAEFMDVSLHPFKSKVLIQEPSVEVSMLVHILAGQEPECRQAVLDCHTDKGVVGVHLQLRHPIPVAIAQSITSSVNVELHGQVGSVRRREHTEE